MLSLPKRASDQGTVLVRFFECPVVSSRDQFGWRRAAARVEGHRLSLESVRSPASKKVL